MLIARRLIMRVPVWCACVPLDVQLVSQQSYMQPAAVLLESISILCLDTLVGDQN